MVADLFQPMHLLMLLGVALLVFGPKRLPDLGRSLGSGLRELKQGLGGHEDQPAESADLDRARRLETAAGSPAAMATDAPTPASSAPHD